MTLIPVFTPGGRWGSGRWSSSWIAKNALLYDTFTTPDAAPITSPRTCEPGPGTLTFVQTDGTQALSDGSFVFTAQATPVWGDQGFHGTAQTRAAGLALVCPLTLSTWEECGVGWHTAAAVVDPDSMEHAIQANTTNGQFDTEAPVLAVASGLSASTEYKVLQVLRDNGCFYVIDGKLYWASDSGNTATLYPSFSNLDGAGSMPDAEVLPLADYNAAWGGDWTEVLGERAAIANNNNESYPAAETIYAECDMVRPAPVTSSNYLYLTHTTEGAKLQIGSLSTNEDIIVYNSETSSSIGSLVGGLPAGATTKMKVTIDDNKYIRVYANNVLAVGPLLLAGGAENTDKLTHKFSGVGEDQANCIINPYPALGIATSRVVAPQTTDTYTHENDFVAEIKNIVLPSAGDMDYQFRISGSDELTLRFNDDGSVTLLDNATSRIAGGAATVTDADDIVLVCEGANGEVFVGGTSVGTTSAIAITTGTAGKRLDATDGVCDHIAVFPRDVSGLLPKELT